MTASRCTKCQGTGIERLQVHGVWPSGEECVEPIKCDACDGFGWDLSALNDREAEQFIHQQITGTLLPP